MKNLLRNLRFSLRQLRKSPVFTLTAVLTLALGIGATTAIYTVVYATLLAPMPYPKPDQLVMVWLQVHGHRNGVSVGDFQDWKRQTTVFQNLVAFTGAEFNLAGQQEPEIVQGQLASPGMYSMMGVHFTLGRDFLPDEGVDGKDHEVIITNRLWKRLGADPKIIGKTLTLDQKTYTIVGVWGPGQPDRLGWDVVVPMVFKPEQINHDFHWFVVMGRLKDGVTMQQANAEMAAIADRVAQANPRSNKGVSATVEPLQNDFLDKDIKTTLWLLLGAVAFVLLIACVNVANLLLSKGATRQTEIAIRSAIGATRRDVFVQFITESLMLAAIGGVMGVGLGYAMLRGFIAVMPPDTLPSEADLRLDLPVLLVTLAATTVAGLLFGCAPAWYASRVDPAEALKEGGRAGSSRIRNRLRQILVVGEFALALSLLAGAGLAIHSFWNLNNIDLGVQTDHVLVFGLPMNKGASVKPDQIVGYYRQIVRSIESATGVQSASVSTGFPLAGTGFGTSFTIVGQAAYSDPSQQPNTGMSMVTPDYYKTYGIRLDKGRFFTEADDAGSLHVAVVNEEFVRRFLPGKDPIGRTLMIDEIVPGVRKRGAPQPWLIVGVFHDVRGGSFERQFPEVDVPFYQSSWTGADVGVRTSGDPAAMTRTIAAAVHSIDPTVPLAHAETLEQIHDEDLSQNRFILVLYLIFGVIALLLAVAGIYGVMSFSVAQREHEIGLRMALGASRGNVVSLVLKEAMALALLGLSLGLVGAYFVGRAMQSTLYGVGSVDITAFSAVALVLLSASFIASWIPARRAAGIDPMQALRTE
jgi:putative ABC transport system permease protein